LAVATFDAAIHDVVGVQQELLDRARRMGRPRRR
jgi:hypothetical protein